MHPQLLAIVTELEDATALEIMAWAHAEFGGGLVVTSSLADTVMISLAERVGVQHQPAHLCRVDG